ncbi:MAG: hypothetical protein KGH95_08040, partial [Thaumarchaeota archaeon]|nr:hypothetical protein [Nitrososphaerota archaeon]
MTSGETFLKVTDYPFAFSITLLLLRAYDIKDVFSDQNGIFLLIAGFTGTALTILDPVGRIIQNYFISIEKMNYLETEKLSRIERRTLLVSKKIRNTLDKLRKKFNK